MKILILCTGNSCRSQMAHGFLQSFNPQLEVYSAGTHPTGMLNADAVRVMAEVGIDITTHTSDAVADYLDQAWDYVITVCSGAERHCPTFTGQVKHRRHFGFDDPSEVKGSPEVVDAAFRSVRDAIKNRFFAFYVEEILQKPLPRCACLDADN